MDANSTTINKRTNYDATFCGKIPLHQTNQIQPHGLLLVVDQQSFQILQSSENTEDFFCKPVTAVVQTVLPDYIQPAEAAALKSRLTADDTKSPVRFTANGRKWLATVQSKGDFFIAEITGIDTGVEDQLFADVYQDLKQAIAAIDAAPGTQEACQVAVTELKRISGFDKIMIYRFDAEWNGEVIAEEMEPGMDAYMGLKFPASDVPKPARDMYKKNAYRLIPNVAYQPVKLYPVLNPLLGGFTDLSDSSLRSVAPVHLEYLRNMQVTASMSTRILKEGELWGLIACHHREAKYLSYEVCSIFELLSGVISAKISAVQKTDKLELRAERMQLLLQIAKSIYLSDNLVKGLNENGKSLLQLLSADGMALSLNGKIHLSGQTPSLSEVQDLVYWLQTNNVEDAYHQPSIANVYEGGKEYAEKASGMLAFAIDAPDGNYLMAFRQEEVEKISWGGDPNNPMHIDADGKGYHPRNSFKTWQETVRYTASPWQEAEVEMGQHFRHYLVEYLKRNEA